MTCKEEDSQCATVRQGNLKVCDMIVVHPHHEGYSSAEKGGGHCGPTRSQEHRWTRSMAVEDGLPLDDNVRVCGSR